VLAKFNTENVKLIRGVMEPDLMHAYTFSNQTLGIQTPNKAALNCR